MQKNNPNRRAVKADEQNFPSFLRSLRQQRGLTLEDVKRKTGIAVPNLSAIETGKKRCGPQISERLADALQVRGALRDTFVTAAATTTVRGRGAEHERVLIELIKNSLDAAGIRTCRAEFALAGKMRHDLLVTINETLFAIDIKVVPRKKPHRGIRDS